MVIAVVLGAIALFVFGFLVGRNNPNLTAVNRLIADGEAIVNTAGKVITVVKKG